MKKRVKIPTSNAQALLDLARKMREKHLTDGETSPLKIMDWNEVGPIIDAAIEADERALRLKREKLLMYQHRRRLLQDLTAFVRNSRDILTGVHSVEMKNLGLWGFDVLDNKTSDVKQDDMPTQD